MSSGSNSHPVGIVFGITLALSWTVMTTGIALAMWYDRHESVVRLLAWASLWLFTVLAPTSSALAIHRFIRRLADSGVSDASSVAELAGLRPLLLLSANMALLSACALVFGR